MKKYCLYLSLFLCLSLPSQAQELSIRLEKAESLSEYISDEQRYNTSHLCISGPIGGKDIKLLRAMAGGGFNEMESSQGILEHLDLSQAQIVESDIPYYCMGNNFYTKANTLGTFMFYNCRQLKSIILPKNLISIEYAAFSYSKIDSLHIPESIEQIQTTAFEKAEQLQNIFVKANNQYYQDVDGVVFSKDLSTLVFFPCGRTDSYNIPQTCAQLAANAFHGSQLSKVQLSSNINEIPEMAFYEAHIRYIYLHEGIRQIGQSAFSQCPYLESIYLPASIQRLDYRAFSFLPQLKSVYIAANEPPSCNQAFEGSFDKDPILHVPYGCIENYLPANGYNFGAFSRIREYSPTGMNPLTTHQTNNAYYRLDGSVAQSNSTGILIIRQADGSTIKVLQARGAGGK